MAKCLLATRVSGVDCLGINCVSVACGLAQQSKGGTFGDEI